MLSKYGPPKQAPKPPPLPTGPLNSTSTPQVQALPVQRRGSYAQLKRGSGAGDGAAEAAGSAKAESPNVIGMLKKATHWEVRIMVMIAGAQD